MRHNHVYVNTLILTLMSLTVFAYHSLPNSYGQELIESPTQPGLFIENTESPKELPRHCESPTQPGLFIPCEFSTIEGSNTEFCESETQPGLFLLCDTPSPKPVSYCESETQPGLFVLCVKTDEAENLNLSSLEQRVMKLESIVNNITKDLDTLKENQNTSILSN